MSTDDDAELRGWMTDWQEGAAPAASAADDDAVRRRVRRQSREMTVTAAVELLLAAGMLAFLVRYAVRHPTAIDIATMAAFALLVVASVAGSLWSQRGLWRPVAEDTATYLGLAIRRCRQRAWALRAGWWLLAAETALFVPWFWVHRGGAVGLPLAYGILALLVAAAGAGLVFVGRRTRRELAELEALRGALTREE